MTSITKQVWEIIDNDITIKRDLERGIINVSALSQYILDTYKIKGSLDSVISSIRRYKSDKSMRDDFARISRALSDAVISTKTNISLITLRNAPNTYKYVNALMASEGFLKSDIFRLLKNRHEVQITVDRDSTAKAKSFLSEAAVEETRGSLVEISIQLTKEGWETPGVLSRVSNELALQDVSIVATFSLYPTITILVEEKDLLRSHEALVRLSGK